MNPFKPNKNVMLLCVSVLAASVLASTGFAAWVIQGDNTNPEGQGTLNGGADYVFLGDTNGIDITMNPELPLPSFGTYFFDNGKDNTAIKEAPLEYKIDLNRSKMSQTMIDLNQFTLKCTFGLYSKTKKTYYGNAGEIVKFCKYGATREGATKETIASNGSTGSVDLLFVVPDATSTSILSFNVTHYIVIAAHQAMKADSTLTLNDFTFRLSFGLGGNA